MSKPVDMNTPTQTNMARQAFEIQKKAYAEIPFIPYSGRISLLKTIEEILLENDAEICDAISKDFGNRSIHESKILEISSIILGLRYTRKKLKAWMKPEKRHTSLVFWGGKNMLIPQPKGIIGIVVPWNYPFFLALGPITSAIAAGNRVMVKQAADSQNLCRLLQEKFSERIPEDTIAILPGVASSDFSNLPYDHMVFTGSSSVGKTIMRSAAENLVPVTLELGGKSPTILCDDFDLDKAVERIMYAKLINAGQTCVAPDYLFIPENKLDQFVEKAKAVTLSRYPDLQTSDYTAIINQKAFSRLMTTIEDATQKGATAINLLPGPQADESLQKISPTIITSVNDEMIVMQEEIFGPILPIMPYRSIDEVIRYINVRDRPLALYPFSNNRRLIDQIIQKTMSGGVTVNDCAMHVAQHDIPFGGIGNSGMGQYHAHEGFLEFSKMRPVFRQAGKALSITPPYGAAFDKIYNAVKRFKWLS